MYGYEKGPGGSSESKVSHDLYDSGYKSAGAGFFFFALSSPTHILNNWVSHQYGSMILHPHDWCRHSVSVSTPVSGVYTKKMCLRHENLERHRKQLARTNPVRVGEDARQWPPQVIQLYQLYMHPSTVTSSDSVPPPTTTVGGRLYQCTKRTRIGRRTTVIKQMQSPIPQDIIDNEGTEYMWDSLFLSLVDRARLELLDTQPPPNI